MSYSPRIVEISRKEQVLVHYPIEFKRSWLAELKDENSSTFVEMIEIFSRKKNIKLAGCFRDHGFSWDAKEGIWRRGISLKMLLEGFVLNLPEELTSSEHEDLPKENDVQFRGASSAN